MKKTESKFKEETIPYFSWDRSWSVAEIRRRLSGKQAINVIAWILREAKFSDVWQFVTPAEVLHRFPELKGKLGRKHAFWEYILDEWQKLGKL